MHIVTDTRARHAPHVLANNHAAHGIEQSLIEAMEVSLGGDSAIENSIGHSRRNVMRQFQQVPEENIEEPIMCLKSARHWECPSGAYDIAVSNT